MALVSLSPAELVFDINTLRSDEKSISEKLTITNVSTSNIAYKVKTTAPKKYSVRPNSGVLLPNANVQVTVTLQVSSPMDPNEIRKDKFLVESIVFQGGDTPQWSTLPAESIIKTKFRCRLADDGKSSSLQESTNSLFQSASGVMDSTPTKPASSQSASTSKEEPKTLQAEYSAYKAKSGDLDKTISTYEAQLQRLNQEYDQLSASSTGLTQRRKIVASPESLTGTTIRRKQGYSTLAVVITCAAGIIVGLFLSRFFS